MEWIKFPAKAIIIGTDGNAYSIRQCSAGRSAEFQHLLRQLAAALEAGGGDWMALYLEPDIMVKTLIDRSLEVCGLSAQWLSLDQIKDLLFERWDEDLQANIPGQLIELNRPKGGSSGSSGSGGSGSGRGSVDLEKIAEVVAMLSVSESIGSALDLAYEVPIDLLQEILQQREKLFAKAGQKGEGQPVTPDINSDRAAQMLALLDAHNAAKGLIAGEPTDE